MDATTPPLDQRLVEIVRAWAAERAPISRAWIFGSRAKGTARPDSDLDVAVEVEPAPGMTARETYEHDLAWLIWECDLLDDLGSLRLHLVLLDGDLTPMTSAGVREAGVKVFDRAGDPPVDRSSVSDPSVDRRGHKMMRARPGRADKGAVLAILDKVPDVPPEPGDEIPGTNRDPTRHATDRCHFGVWTQNDTDR